MAAASAALTASVLRLLIIYLWSVAGRLAPAAVCLNSPPSAESAENNSQRLQHDRPTGAGLSLPWLGRSLAWRRLGTSGGRRSSGFSWIGPTFLSRVSRFFPHTLTFSDPGLYQKHQKQTKQQKRKSDVEPLDCAAVMIAALSQTTSGSNQNLNQFGKYNG